MKVEILKDATLTLTAGQIVEIKDSEAVHAVKLGLVAPVKEKKPTKRTK
jgi:hypothetical protein